MAQVFVLGAGTPTPTPHRLGSAFAVEVGGEYLMFDCGPAATHKLVKMEIFPTQVDYLFFTHHHFDHDVDYWISYYAPKNGRSVEHVSLVGGPRWRPDASSGSASGR